MTKPAVSTEYRRVTDGRTDILPRHSLRYACASRGKSAPLVTVNYHLELCERRVTWVQTMGRRPRVFLTAGRSPQPTESAHTARQQTFRSLLRCLRNRKQTVVIQQCRCVGFLESYSVEKIQVETFLHAILVYYFCRKKSIKYSS